MKYDFLLRVSGRIFSSMIKHGIPDKQTLKNIRLEYKAIMKRSKDIGNHNVLIISYAMGAFFIAMNRKTNLTPEENIKIFHEGIEKSKFTKLSLGDSSTYFSEKKRSMRRAWEQETALRKYENDWVVKIHEEEPDVYGIDYLECGLCKLCKDEGCFEYAKYLCSLDYMLADVMGLKLTRTTTIAEGGDKCDFRYKIK